MKNPMQSPTSPTIPEPTAAEIQQANDFLERSYDFTLEGIEAVRFVKLVKELRWWQRARAEDGTPEATLRQFTDELKLALPSVGQAIDPTDLAQDAHLLLTALALQEKKRATQELTALIVEHRPVPIDPAVTDKAALFLKKKYEIELEEEQFGQVIQYAWRTLWMEEGLEASLAACLGDLLDASEGYDQHRGVVRALDRVIGELRGRSQYSAFWREKLGAS
jgi:hypothetical protein